MRDLFEDRPAVNPLEAARRGARPELRRRFYREVQVVAVEAGYAVRLDGKPMLTPARRVLAAPSRPVAEAIATEWQAQQDVITPGNMPLTRLANAIIDGVADRPEPVAAEVAKYLTSDLVFYRADGPPGLVERQRRHWDPIMRWAAETLGAQFQCGEGIVHVAQPEQALAAASAAIPSDPWRLGAVNSATTLTGSALIALALAHRRIDADEAWQAALVDEDWNMETWGRDEIALQRRTFHFGELQAAATVLMA